MPLSSRSLRRASCRSSGSQRRGPQPHTGFVPGQEHCEQELEIHNFMSHRSNIFGSFHRVVEKRILSPSCSQKVSINKCITPNTNIFPIKLLREEQNSTAFTSRLIRVTPRARHNTGVNSNR